MNEKSPDLFQISGLPSQPAEMEMTQRFLYNS